MWNKLIARTMTRKGLHAYYFPEARLGRDVIWDGMDNQGRPFMDYLPYNLIKRRDSQKMHIETTNGSMIKIFGVDHMTNVGTNPVTAILSEYSVQDPKGWQLLRPIFKANKGQVMFNFTPRGKNHAHDLSLLAQENPDWFYEILTIEDTGLLNQDDMDEERKTGMPEDLLLQEYYCSFTLSPPGAYYAEQMMALETSHRITKTTHDPRLPVHTAWDIGVNDPTCIWYFQVTTGGLLTFIDYSEISRGDIYKALDELKEKPYRYGTHLAPHDINAKHFSAKSTSREIAKNHGVNLVVVPKTEVFEGIRTTRSLLMRCVFDKEKCRRGISALKDYACKWDEKNRTYTKSPIHNWASHAADALRVLATGEQFLGKSNFDKDDLTQSRSTRPNFQTKRHRSTWMGA